MLLSAQLVASKLFNLPKDGIALMYRGRKKGDNEVLSLSGVKNGASELREHTRQAWQAEAGHGNHIKRVCSHLAYEIASKECMRCTHYFEKLVQLSTVFHKRGIILLFNHS